MRPEADHILGNVLGLIPARGGSKSIPRKNIALLAGRPLLHYTCEAALGSRVLSRVVLSTDDAEIAGIGRDAGVEVPFQRPAELSRDDTPSAAVVRHAVRVLTAEGWQPDIIVLLQPTSPLRQSYQIDEAVELLAESRADTVVSVTELPHRFSPYAAMRLRDGALEDFWQQPLPYDRFTRQNMPPLYARNGPAILASRVHVLVTSETLYGNRVLPYIMTEEDSVDIDTSFDLRVAEWLIARRSIHI